VGNGRKDAPREMDDFLRMNKRVYLIRHGEADWPNWDKADEERPLTRKGKAEAKRVAKFLKRIGAEPLIMFTSPLPRANQTAEIFAKELCLELAVAPILGKGFNVEKFQRIVTKNDVEELALVGHEPDFTNVVRGLTRGDVHLSKCGVALIERRLRQKGKTALVIPASFREAMLNKLLRERAVLTILPFPQCISDPLRKITCRLGEEVFRQFERGSLQISFSHLHRWQQLQRLA